MDVLPWWVCSFFHCHWMGPNDSISPTDWWNPRFGLEPRNMESLGLFLVWELPFGGKFGDDVGWPKKASQVASVGGSKRHFPWSLIKSSGFFLRDVWFLYLRCRLRDASSRPDFRCLKIFGNLKWKAEWMKTKGVIIKYKLGKHFKNYVLCLSRYEFQINQYSSGLRDFLVQFLKFLFLHSKWSNTKRKKSVKANNDRLSNILQHWR